MLTVDITIPVLNEQDTLEKNVYLLKSFLSKTFNHSKILFKIIIADNGSSDNTAIIGKKLVSANDDIIYYRLEEKGVGLALKHSWSRSSADILGYMDLDFSTDLNHLIQVVDLLSKSDIDFVNGSRLAPGAQVIGRKLMREISSRSFNFILKHYFKTKFTDGMCGFKFGKRKCLLECMKGGATSNNWFFSTELLIVAEKNKFKIAEIPVKWTDDPNSKVKIIKLSLEYLRSMYYLKQRINDLYKAL